MLGFYFWAFIPGLLSLGFYGYMSGLLWLGFYVWAFMSGLLCLGF